MNPTDTRAWWLARHEDRIRIGREDVTSAEMGVTAARLALKDAERVLRTERKILADALRARRQFEREGRKVGAFVAVHHPPVPTFDDILAKFPRDERPDLAEQKADEIDAAWDARHDRRTA